MTADARGETRGVAEPSADASPVAREVDRLAERIGHRFADPGLLERALTHRSAGARNNERLEFLGDAILSFLVADRLFGERADASEGKLTRLRARLVRRETLAAVAREIGLGRSLRLGPGELKTGGRDRDSILADAFEALVGALYLDAGVETCRARVMALFAQRIAKAGVDDGVKDPKTRLQEILQGRGMPLPSYEVVRLEGEAHRQSFTVSCTVEGLAEPAIGTGASRRKAEQDAATRALERLDVG